MEDKLSVTRIKPSKCLRLINFKELWNSRELLLVLTGRSIKIRYKQTVIGGLWAVLQPFLMMVVFTIFFSKLGESYSSGIPYAVFSYTGLLLWNYFSNSVSTAGESLIRNESLITKVYFPRILIPLSETISGLLDYFIAGLVAIGLMLYYRLSLPISILLVPFLLLLTWMLTSGVSLWTAALNVKYRDVRYATPFFIRLFLFVTPVIYPVSAVGQYRWIMLLNPLSGLVEAHRALILGTRVDLEMLVTSIVLTALVFIGGSIYFKRVERNFADII